jgi:hypothetical protein
LHTLLGWYREADDIEAQLPLLATMLGHVDPVDTYWYLEGAPELLALAAARLERTWEKPVAPAPANGRAHPTVLQRRCRSPRPRHRRGGQ